MKQARECKETLSGLRPTKRRSIELTYPQKQLCRAPKAPRRCRIGYAG